MERAIAYIRVSDPKQVTEGNSLVTQENDVRRFATSLGYEIDRVFIEEGETAKTDNRTQLKVMLAYAQEHKGKLQILIVPKIDRLARNISDYLNIKLQFQRLGLRVESVGERLDDSPVGRLTESVLASVAQFDNEIRAERCRGGMVQAVKEGRWVWHAPKGYLNTSFNGKATIMPDPEVAPKIAEAFRRLATAGWRPKDVRDWLKSEGIALSRSYTWRLFRNKAYIGVIEAFGLQERGAPPFLPLISEEIFGRAQLAFEPRATTGTINKDNADFPLRGTAICGDCRSYFTGCWSHGSTQRYAYYRCKNCKGVNVPRDLMERQFLRGLAQHRLPARDLNLVLKHLTEKSKAIHEHAARAESKQRKEILRLEQLLSAVALKNAEGVIPDYLAKQQIETTERSLLQKRARLQSTVTEGSNHGGMYGEALRFIAYIDHHWQKADVMARKQIQRLFFPSGWTFTPIKNDRGRTSWDDESTGSKSILFSLLLRVVDHSDSKPNRGAARQGDLTSLATLLLRIHHELTKHRC